MPEILVDQRELRLALHAPLAALHSLHSILVLVESQQTPLAAQSLQNGTRMAAATEGDVDIHAVGTDIKPIHRLGEHHGSMVFTRLHCLQLSSSIALTGICAKQFLRHLGKVAALAVHLVVGLTVPQLYELTSRLQHNLLRFRYHVLLLRRHQQPVVRVQLDHVAFRQLAQQLAVLAAVGVQLLLQFLHFLPETGVCPQLQTLGIDTLAYHKTTVLSLQLPLQRNWELEATVRVHLTVFFSKY